MKKILIVNNGLNFGGVEKSLINLLNSIDMKKYQIDLYLFAGGTALLNEVPSEVHLIGQTPCFRAYYEYSLIDSIKFFGKRKEYKLVFNRIKRSVLPRLSKKYRINSKKNWEIQKSLMAMNDKEYDIAIGYMEGGANFYVVDCVKASRKIGWIHTDYGVVDANIQLEMEKLQKLDAVVTVSNNSKQSLIKLFPKFERKIFVVPNMMDTHNVNELALIEPEVEMNSVEFNIVSVGRLTELKGFQFCPEVCAKLHEHGIPARWFVVGDGDYRKTLEKEIDKWNVREYFHLVGATRNPYAYMSRADVCVQPSKYEGRGIVVEEAMYLQKPTVVSDIGAFRELIEDKKNGIIVERNANSICLALSEIYYSEELRTTIISNLEETKVNNDLIMSKIYKIIEGESN